MEFKNDVKYLFSEHGEVCIMCDDVDATTLSLDTTKHGSYSVETMDINNKFSQQIFTNLDDALDALELMVNGMNTTFDFLF